MSLASPITALVSLNTRGAGILNKYLTYNDGLLIDKHLPHVIKHGGIIKTEDSK